VTPEDVELLADFEARVSHNPISNLKLGSGIAPVPAMLSSGVTVGLGTDGAASNNTLDPLRDLQVAALIHKAVAGDPTVLPARTALEMLTVRGAQALGLQSIGMLREGYQADLTCIAVDGPHTTPMYDPISHLVFAARSHDVRHVMVHGRVVVRNRELQTLDRERIEAHAREFSETVSDR
jgi:5-methylthioadenosine/S-adenosylhomocysteine deaminase